MLPTIPFKRHSTNDAKSNKAKRHNSSVSKNAMQRQSSPRSEHVAKTKSTASGLRFRPWVVVIFVLVIAVVGIVILRFSRASGGEPAGIPVSMFDIQNKVTILLTQQPSPTGDLPVSGYAEFHYSPTTSDQVKEVVYYLDSKLVSSSTKSPFSFVFDSSRFQNDSYVLTAVAFNASNTPIAATQRTIVINNSGGILQGAKNLVTYPWYALFNL